jgi:hypothetical protein
MTENTTISRRWTSASSDVDFDDYGVFGYQLEPEYTEEELKQMEEAASAQRREIVVFSVISLIVKN